MSLLNTGCLTSTLQADINGATTGYAAGCFVTIAAGVDSATQNRSVFVSGLNVLPVLWPTQSLPVGQIAFVDSLCIPVVSASGQWIGFDGRVVSEEGPPLFTWGRNAQGELGDGTTISKSSPATTAGNSQGWKSISAGSGAGINTAMAGIKNNGTLWTWGAGLNGWLGSSDIANRSSPGTITGGGTNWLKISVGAGHMAGIKTDGTLWTWGANLDGQLGTGTTTPRSSPGTVAGGGTDWCDVATGRSVTAAIKTDGTLWTWGSNNYGQLGNGAIGGGRSSPVTIASGGTNWTRVATSTVMPGNGGHTVALKSDGTVWGWGANGNSQLGDGTTTNRTSPVTTSGGGTTWCAISVGAFSTYAIKTDGTLWGWGENGTGELGDGTITRRSSPVTTAGGGTTWRQIGAGQFHGLAVKTDGTLWSWGWNNSGQVGDGSIATRSSPVTVAGGLTSWVSACGAACSSIAIRCF